jgi:N-acyl homoserine lactone hydrolase
MAGLARRMYLLQYGAEYVPKWMSVAGAGTAPNWEPVVGILVETDIGWASTYEDG